RSARPPALWRSGVGRVVLSRGVPQADRPALRAFQIALAAFTPRSSLSGRLGGFRRFREPPLEKTEHALLVRRQRLVTDAPLDLGAQRTREIALEECVDDRGVDVALSADRARIAKTRRDLVDRDGDAPF